MFGLSKLQLVIGAGLVAIIVTLGGLLWLKSWELTNCQSSHAAVTQAEKDTNKQAKGEQKQADAESKRQKREITQRATKATAKASVIAAQARSDEKRTGQKIKRLKGSPKLWEATPIPASILEAIKKN